MKKNVLALLAIISANLFATGEPLNCICIYNPRTQTVIRKEALDSLRVHRDELRDLTATHKNLVAEMASLVAKHDAMRASLNSELDALRTAVAERDALLAELTQKRDAMRASLDSELDALRTVGAQRDALQSTLSGSRNINAEYSLVISRQHALIAAFTDTICNLATRVADNVLHVASSDILRQLTATFPTDLVCELKTISPDCVDLVPLVREIAADPERKTALDAICETYGTSALLQTLFLLTRTYK